MKRLSTPVPDLKTHLPFYKLESHRLRSVGEVVGRQLEISTHYGHHEWADARRDEYLGLVQTVSSRWRTSACKTSLGRRRKAPSSARCAPGSLCSNGMISPKGWSLSKNGLPHQSLLRNCRNQYEGIEDVRAGASLGWDPLTLLALAPRVCQTTTRNLKKEPKIQLFYILLGSVDPTCRVLPRKATEERRTGCRWVGASA